MKKIGFIGAGNITKAMLAGIMKNAPEYEKAVLVSNRSEEKLQSLKNQYSQIEITMDNKVVAANADYLFLSVKPNMYAEVIVGIKECIREETIVICPAAGLSIAFTEECFGGNVKVVRCMPNTPSMMGLGMTGICPNAQVSEEELADVVALFELMGKCEVVTEDLFHTVTGVSGSGPAYVYLFINSMAKAAQKDGMPYEQAVKFAAQTALGAAEMVLSSGIDPETLVKNVCSPGGTTIEAVQTFENEGLEELVYKAQHACVEKSKKLAK